MTNPYFIGIDVGTGSARAGIFDAQGRMAAQASEPIKMWKPKADFVQQSSDDIWAACCISVKRAMKKSGIKPDEIQGIGFDATCSLVVLNEKDQPVTVSPGGESKQNIIVWMDHRANKEADEINQTGHDVLNYVGGVISPEMQTPKLLWLKRHMPETWQKAAKFFDLPDFLVYKATGVDVRSACTTTCKWTYLCHEESTGEDSIGRWDDSFFKEIGLGDLVDEEYRRIGTKIRPVGEAAGAGLTPAAAKDLDLKAGIPVGVSMIDAHAGGLGLLGMNPDGDSFGEVQFDTRIALIGGTSSCHMAVSQEPIFINGVWGPYYSAMLPGYWLNEGGQSATGALIDHIIFSSPHSGDLINKAKDQNTSIYDLLNERLTHLAQIRNLEHVSMLTKELHILPYFHGNRSPRANPSLKGTMTGLTLSSTLDDLAIHYLATIQAIAYGTRHIIETMNQNGYSIKKIMATGGGTKNEIFLQEHADICGCQIVLPREKEAVLLGSAVLGAVASGKYSTIFHAMQKMNQPGKIIEPNRGPISRYHNSKYRVFHKMYEDNRSYYKLMYDELE